jgi:20S proteasome alpha/beta subunit
MTGCKPDASAPGTPVIQAGDQIVGLAFGKYVVTAADSRATAKKTVPELDADAQAEPEIGAVS